MKDLVMRLKANERTRQTAIDTKASPPGMAKLTLPEISKVKRHFLVNSFALHETILEKLEGAVQSLLTKRESERSKRTGH